MRTLLIIGLLSLLAGFLLSGRVATSQEEPSHVGSRGAWKVSDRWAFDISPYYWTAKRVPRGSDVGVGWRGAPLGLGADRNRCSGVKPIAE